MTNRETTVCAHLMLHDTECLLVYSAFISDNPLFAAALEAHPPPAWRSRVGRWSRSRAPAGCRSWRVLRVAAGWWRSSNRIWGPPIATQQVRTQPATTETHSTPTLHNSRAAGAPMLKMLSNGIRQYLLNCSMMPYFSMISVEGLAIASKLSVILQERRTKSQKVETQSNVGSPSGSQENGCFRSVGNEAF